MQLLVTSSFSYIVSVSVSIARTARPQGISYNVLKFGRNLNRCGQEYWLPTCQFIFARRCPACRVKMPEPLRMSPRRSVMLLIAERIVRWPCSGTNQAVWALTFGSAWACRFPICAVEPLTPRLRLPAHRPRLAPVLISLDAPSS